MVIRKSSEYKSGKHVLMAASEKCYFISTGLSIFVLYIQLSCNKLFLARFSSTDIVLI